MPPTKKVKSAPRRAGALKGAGAPKGASVPKRVSAPKGAHAPNSSTPKRPANSPPGSPSELENTKRNKIHISPKVAPPVKSSKNVPLSSNASKAPAKRVPKPTTTSNPPVSKTATVSKTKTSTSATTTEQRTHFYSTVASQPSTSRHKTQADKEFSSNPSPALKSPSSAPSIVVPDTPNPSTPQPPQDTHTNAFYIHFDPKIWKDETAVLVALNSEYPFLTYNIKGKLGQSLTITVPNVEQFTVLASLKQLKNKPISFVPKQPFTPSIQSVISNVPATVSARSFLSINEIVSAERMFNWSQPLKSKVPTTNIKVVYRAFSLPYKIKLDGNCFDIRPFVPAPNHCKQCCQFGHSSFVCNSEQVCSICSGSHFFKQCPTPNNRKCPNCSLPHSANWGGCPVRKKAAQIIINSVKPVPLMSLKITPPPHVRKPFITATSPRNPNPYWPEARPLTVTPASKPTNIAPKQPTSLRSQDSQTDITTPKQPTRVINQSSQTHDTLTPEQPTSLSNQSTQTVITPPKIPDTDTTPDSPVYSLQMIDYIQFTIAPHNESPESSFAYIFKPLAEALNTAAFNIDPENSTSLKHCQANIQQLIFLMHLTLQMLGVFDD